MTQRTYHEVKIEQYDKWLVERDLEIAELEMKLMQERRNYEELEHRVEAHWHKIQQLKQRIEELETELKAKLV